MLEHQATFVNALAPFTLYTMKKKLRYELKKCITGLATFLSFFLLSLSALFQGAREENVNVKKENEEINNMYHFWGSF